MAEDLFRLRNELKKSSLKQFRRYLDHERVKLSPEAVSSLFTMVYEDDHKYHWVDYLSFFAKLHSSVLHTEVGHGQRRLLQDLCHKLRSQDYREIIRLMLDFKADIKQYHLLRLVGLAIDGGKFNSQEAIIDTIHQILESKKYLGGGGEAEEGWLVKTALRRDMMQVAQYLIRHRVGRISHEGDELFMLASFKIPKRDANALYSFVDEYLDQTKFNARQLSHNGRTFFEKMPKDYQNRIEEIIRGHSKSVEKKEQPRRSQNKAKSSLGPGEHPKQYSESVGPSSTEVAISIQSAEDEKAIQSEASRIHRKYVEEKEKNYKYEKGQKKEAVARTGILKSEQLRYYLEEDIQYEVSKIKQQNQELRPLYNEVLDRVIEHLTKELDIKMQVYGSFVTELALVESDIDLVAFGQKKAIEPVQLLQLISREMEKMTDYIDKVQLIKTATVPIIKAVCTKTYYEKNIDITYKNYDHNGLQAMQLIRRYLKAYPQLEPLIFILKKFIYTSGLSAPYKGGLSSYGLVLMIVAYMQQAYKAKQLEGQQEHPLVADLLIGFLKFYGFKFNYVMKCITLVDHDIPQMWNKYTGCVAPYNSIDLQPRLAIIDPLNNKNNVGRSTHKIKQIQMAFEIAYICIHTFRTCGRRRRCESCRRISKADVNLAYIANERPCCIIKRMFSCTEKFIKD